MWSGMGFHGRWSMKKLSWSGRSSPSTTSLKLFKIASMEQMAMLLNAIEHCNISSGMASPAEFLPKIPESPWLQKVLLRIIKWFDVDWNFPTGWNSPLRGIRLWANFFKTEKKKTYSIYWRLLFLLVCGVNCFTSLWHFDAVCSIIIDSQFRKGECSLDLDGGRAPFVILCPDLSCHQQSLVLRIRKHVFCLQMKAKISNWLWGQFS